MSWLYLGIAVILEVAVGLFASKANGFTRLWWTIATLASGAIATFFLSLALLTFDVGVGDARTSVAGVGIVIVGALFLDQRLNWRKALGILIVIGGVVGHSSAAPRVRVHPSDEINETTDSMTVMITRTDSKKAGPGPVLLLAARSSRLCDGAQCRRKRGFDDPRIGPFRVRLLPPDVVRRVSHQDHSTGSATPSGRHRRRWRGAAGFSVLRRGVEPGPRAIGWRGSSAALSALKLRQPEARCREDALEYGRPDSRRCGPTSPPKPRPP